MILIFGHLEMATAKRGAINVGIKLKLNTQLSLRKNGIVGFIRFLTDCIISLTFTNEE